MNYYQGYSYPQYQQNPMNMMTAQAPMAAASSLQGKVVDSEDMVRASEVAFGGYGVFPKADLSAVYIKTWNNNGSTSIITYKPEINEKKEIDSNQILLDKIQAIEDKIDAIVNTTSKKETVSKPIGKETIKNVY